VYQKGAGRQHGGIIEVVNQRSFIARAKRKAPTFNLSRQRSPATKESCFVNAFGGVEAEGELSLPCELSESGKNNRRKGVDGVRRNARSQGGKGKGGRRKPLFQAQNGSFTLFLANSYSFKKSSHANATSSGGVESSAEGHHISHGGDA
jgi:hypothetical protein